jgi:transcriptional regulator with XRE-family HTH domain
MTLRQRLTRDRLARRMTLVRYAVLLGIAPATIQKAMRGGRLTPLTVARIEAVLGPERPRRDHA